MSNIKISLLHATAREERSKMVGRAWNVLSNDPDGVEHVICYSPRAFKKGEPSSPFRNAMVLPDEGRGPIAAYNKAAEASRGELLVLISDDYFAFQGWDSALLEMACDLTQEKLLWVGNIVKLPLNQVYIFARDIMCQPIMTRARMKRYGYFLPPGYFGRATDNELTDMALRDSMEGKCRIIDVRDVLQFQHQDSHPAYEPLEENEPNKGITERYSRDWKRYLKRKALGFPQEDIIE